MSLFAELRRRNVFRVGGAYILVAWLVLQVGQALQPALHLPEWVDSLLAFFLILGLPLALFFAWAFELTPDGLKRETGRPADSADSGDKGRMLDFVLVGLLLAVAGYILWEARFVTNTPEATPQATESAAASSQPPAKEDQNVSTSAEPSIAVLPFVNMSSDPEREYFSDGITEEIINAMVKVPGVAVPARTSVFAFKNHSGDVREIGRTLGVAYVLEGSIRSQEDQVRITAQLIKVADGFHMWSETFDRRLENIFVVQEEIAAAIAAQLKSQLGNVETVPNQTSNMAAYDTYLQGRAALRYREPAAVTLLEAATRIDPEFGPAWASLAIAYNSISGGNAKTIEAANRALELDPQNVDALTALGSTLRDQMKWVEAERHFDRALAEDPDSAELLEDYAQLLNIVGRSPEALAVTTRGMRNDPMILPLVATHAEALFSNHRAEAARESVFDSLRSDDNSLVLWWVALPLWLSPNPAGQLDPLPPLPEPDRTSDWTVEVQELLRESLENPGEDTIARLESLYRKEWDDTRTWGLNRHVARHLLLHFGEVDSVIQYDLENPHTVGSAFRNWTWTPFFAAYRTHPAFPDLLGAWGVIDYWDTTAWPEWCRRDPDQTISCQ